MRDRLSVAFVHPDLGIGGAERLVLDAAAALRDAGHRVAIFTAHRDPEHCFDEARDGSLDVRVHGDFLPRSVGGRLVAPCSILRTLYAGCAMALRRERFDVVFCDLVAHVLPFLRLLTRARLVFYCHYPDRLLMPRVGALYRAYRKPIDLMERLGLGRAHRLIANSEFTASQLRTAFPRFGGAVDVLHPGVDAGPEPSPPPPPPRLLSVNRFERKKNLGLAIEALAALDGLLPDGHGLRLTVAGGYDERLPEARETLAELEETAVRAGVADRVDFVRSPSDAERAELLAGSLAVVYTPTDEHFGIVPLEAMAAARPVVAVASGGPLETIVDDETGFLRPPEPAAFAEALARLVSDPERAAAMGRAGRERVSSRFTKAAFGRRLETMLLESARRHP
jgi:alpha-1,3/alpha-1,6-mannosyltransferase